MLKKITRRFKYTMILLEVLLVLLVFLLVYNFFLPLGKGENIVYFSDSNRTKVLQTLSRHGYNITDWDHLLMKKKHLPKKGWYRLSHTDEGRYHFLNKLNRHPLPAMKVKVYAGQTHRELLHRLAHDMKLDEKKLTIAYGARARFQEGDILADTYHIARAADENQTVSFLFERSKEKREAFYQKHHIHDLDDNTLKVLLTVASIIQKETNDPQEMPLVSSVIYNRLARNMKLQMDGTLNYGKYSHSIVTPERIKSDTSFYNTYKYKGLPPAPLGTVSMDALKAAMFPAASKYLFFMLNKDGSHHFSENYTEHLKYLKAFRKHQKERKQLEKESEEKKLSKERNTTK